MDFKQFLKPVLSKYILTLVFIVATYYIYSTFWIIPDRTVFGFPFYFKIVSGPCPTLNGCTSYNWVALIFDIIIWYFISSLVILGIKRFK